MVSSNIAASAIILGLAPGLTLGLTLPHNEIEARQSDYWKPTAGQSWQIVLNNPIKIPTNAQATTPNVDVFDIDLFTTPQAQIDNLHRLGKKVICYFSAGSYEPYRDDSGDFQESDMGSIMEGWEDERWLKLSSQNVRNIMSKRLDLAKSKKCDAVDPDNVDGYSNKNGLGLKQSDTVDFMRFLADKSHSLGMSIGLKNAAAVIPSTISFLDFSVNEQCVQYEECADFSAFIKAGKPVFNIEYPEEIDDSSLLTKYCKAAGVGYGAEKFSTVIKNMELDGNVEYCGGPHR